MTSINNWMFCGAATFIFHITVFKSRLFCSGLSTHQAIKFHVKDTVLEVWVGCGIGLHMQIRPEGILDLPLDSPFRKCPLRMFSFMLFRPQFLVSLHLYLMSHKVIVKEWMCVCGGHISFLKGTIKGTWKVMKVLW